MVYINCMRLSKIYSYPIQRKKLMEWLSKRNKCSLWLGKKDAAADAILLAAEKYNKSEPVNRRNTIGYK